MKKKIENLTWELKLLRNDSHFVFDVISYYGYYYFQLFLKSFIIYIIFRYIQKCVIELYWNIYGWDGMMFGMGLEIIIQEWRWVGGV